MVPSMGDFDEKKTLISIYPIAQCRTSYELIFRLSMKHPSQERYAIWYSNMAIESPPSFSNLRLVGGFSGQLRLMTPGGYLIVIPLSYNPQKLTMIHP